MQLFVNDARHKVFVRLKAVGPNPAGLPAEIGPIQVANVQLRQGPSIEDIVGTIAQGAPVHGVAGMIDFENTLITIPFEFDYCTDYTGFGYHAGTAQPVRFANFIYLRYRESSNPELPASYVSNYSFYSSSAPSFTTPGNFNIEPGATSGTAKITVPANFEYKIVKAGADAAATGADIVQNWTFGNPTGEYITVTAGDQVYIRVAAVPFVTRHDDRYYRPFPGDGAGNIIAFGRFKSRPSSSGYAITQNDIN